MREAKKKICFIVPTHWAAQMGGAEFQAKILLDHVLRAGKWEVFYLANWVNPDFRPQDYRIIEIKGWQWIRKFGYMFDSPSLLRILEDINPDVIYQRVGCSYTGVAAHYTKRHPDCKMIWHIANDSSFMPVTKRSLPSYVLHSIDRAFLDYGIRNSTHIVAQTDHQGGLLRQHYGREPTAVIPNFHPLPAQVDPKPTDCLRILWVANFKPSKRPEVFVRLASEFADRPDIKFVMIGHPYAKTDYQSELERQIAALPNLEYLGGRTHEEVNGAMADSHLFVSTAAHEGFANTFIQAWLHRVPVVSLQVNPDGLLNGRSLGYAPQDYQSLVSTVRMLVNDPLWLDQCGYEAAQYARSNFSEENVGTLIDLIDEC